MKAMEVLAQLVKYEYGNCHAHLRPGIWDDDNAPGVAGQPCSRCRAFADARALLEEAGYEVPEVDPDARAELP